MKSFEIKITDEEDCAELVTILARSGYRVSVESSRRGNSALGFEEYVVVVEDKECNHADN